MLKTVAAKLEILEHACVKHFMAWWVTHSTELQMNYVNPQKLNGYITATKKLPHLPLKRRAADGKTVRVCQKLRPGIRTSSHLPLFLSVL
jgi:hypothetical protein